MKHMSKKLIQKVETVAENLGWTVSGNSDGDDWLFSIGSPEGQDCNIELSSPGLDNLKQDLKNYVEGYDVSYETYLWLDKWGHGTNGAPYDMRDLMIWSGFSIKQPSLATPYPIYPNQTHIIFNTTASTQRWDCIFMYG